MPCFFNISRMIWTDIILFLTTSSNIYPKFALVKKPMKKYVFILLVCASYLTDAQVFYRRSNLEPLLAVPITLVISIRIQAFSISGTVQACFINIIFPIIWLCGLEEIMPMLDTVTVTQTMSIRNNVTSILSRIYLKPAWWQILTFFNTPLATTIIVLHLMLPWVLQCFIWSLYHLR